MFRSSLFKLNSASKIAFLSSASKNSPIRRITDLSKHAIFSNIRSDNEKEILAKQTTLKEIENDVFNALHTSLLVCKNECHVPVQLKWWEHVDDVELILNDALRIYGLNIKNIPTGNWHDLSASLLINHPTDFKLKPVRVLSKNGNYNAWLNRLDIRIESLRDTTHDKILHDVNRIERQLFAPILAGNQVTAYSNIPPCHAAIKLLEEKANKHHIKLIVNGNIVGAELTPLDEEQNTRRMKL